MKDLEKKLYNEIDSCLFALKNEPYSKQIACDLNQLFSLCKTLQLTDYNVDLSIFFRMFFNTDFFDYYKEYKNNFRTNQIIINTYYNFFIKLFPNGTNDITYNLISQIDITESLDLVYDFLDFFNKKYYETFIAAKEKLIVLNPNSYKKYKYYGAAYGGNSSLTSPRIVIFDFNNLSTCITIAHELSHIYNFSLNHNLSNAEYLQKNTSCCFEINSYYTELCFFDYLSTMFKDDINSCKKEFDEYLSDVIFYLADVFFKNKHNFINFLLKSDNYVYIINDFLGRIIAYILYSLHDIEKGNYICQKIMIDSCHTSLKDILFNEGINLEEYSTHEKVFKLIQKHWN